MKKLSTLLTVAVIGGLSLSAGVAHAGNYRPVNKQAQTGQLTSQNFAAPSTAKVYGPEPATKTAFFYNQCYSVPVCNGGYCTSVVNCNSYCSPCGSRPYFPATSYYGGCGPYGCSSGYGYGMGGYGLGSYGGLGGYGYGNYGLSGYGVGGYGLGGYGGYGGLGGYGVGGYGVGGYGGMGGYGVGGYGGLGGYGGVGGYGVGSPYGSPAIGNPYLGGAGGYGGYGVNPISAPVYNDPLINGPFYP